MIRDNASRDLSSDAAAALTLARGDTVNPVGSPRLLSASPEIGPRTIAVVPILRLELRHWSAAA